MNHQLRDMSDADFDLELCRVEEEYYRAYRLAKKAFPTLQAMQAAWDRCNKWHAKLNELQAEEQRRAELRQQYPSVYARWLDQEIGI